MRLLAEIMDRLSGVAALREKIAQQDRVIEGMQRILLDQQRDLAEIKGALRVVMAMKPNKKLLK